MPVKPLPKSNRLSGPASLRTERIDNPPASGILTSAAIVSLLLHVAVAVAIYNRPIGTLDLSQSARAQQRMQTVRLATDAPAMLPPMRRQEEAVEDEPRLVADELAELGRVLLDTPAVDLASDALPAERAFAAPMPRPERPESDAPGLAAEPMGPAAIPGDVQGELIGELELSVNFNLPVGDPSGGSLAGGEMTAGAGGVGEGFAEQAMSLIGSAAAQPRPAGWPLPRPEPAPLPSTMERPPLDVGPIVTGQPLPVELGDSAIRVGGTFQVPESLDQDFEVTVRTFRRGDGDHYFQIEIRPKETLARLRVMPKDVVFLLDLSGSIPQPWANQSLLGIANSLAALNPQDRFNIVLFAEESSFFATERIVPATEENIARAQEFLRDRRSEGFTDLNLALSRLLVPDRDVERAYNLIFISDGVPTRGVQDTRELINLITRDNQGLASIYTVAIAEPRFQNRTLLEFLAFRNRGLAIHSDSSRQIANDIRRLASRIRYPVMKDVRVTVAGAGASDTFPRQLPNIHRGEQFTVFGRFEEPGPITMRISGHNGTRAFDFTFTRDLSEAEEGSRQMPAQWATMRVHHLYSEMLQADEQREQEILGEIRDLRRRYRIEVLY